MKNCLYGAVLLLIALIYSLIEWRFPIMFDDWAFMWGWKQFSTSDSFSWSNFVEYYNDNKVHQNGRISNALAPFSTILTPWNKFFPIATGIAMAMIVGLVQKLSCYRYRSNSIFYLSLSWILLLIFLPWRDSIFVADYALNYIFAGAITLSFIFLLVKFEERGWKWWTFCCVVVLSIFAGGWHEGFSIPTVGGLGVLIIAKKFKLSKQFYSIVIIYFISALFFFITPGMIKRIGEVVTVKEYYFSVKYFILFLPLAIFIVWNSALAFFRNGRRLLYKTYSNPFIIVGTGVILIGFSISMLPGQPPRSVFWPSMFCVIFFISLIRNIDKFNLSGILAYRVREIVTIILVALCSIQGFVTLYWVNKYRKENDFIINQMNANENGTVFAHLIPPASMSYFTLNIPPKTIWVDPFNYYCLWLYNRKDYMAILPPELKEADWEDGVPIPGNGEFRKIGNSIVSKVRERKADSFIIVPVAVNAIVIYNNGVQEKLKLIEHPFVTHPFKHKNEVFKRDTLMYYNYPANPFKMSNIVSLDTIITLDIPI